MYVQGFFLQDTLYVSTKSLFKFELTQLKQLQLIFITVKAAVLMHHRK